MVALARHVVAQALDAHVRTAHDDAARVVVVRRLRLVGDCREASALDRERLRVHGMRREARDLRVVPDDRRGGIDGSVRGDEEHLLLRRAVVLVEPVADVLAHLAVHGLHETGTGQGHVKLRLSALERLDALHAERIPRRVHAEHRRLDVFKVAVVDHELRRAEVDVRLDDGHLRAAADVVRLAIARPHGQFSLVRRRMRGDDGLLVVRLAIADGAELLVGDHV